MLMSDKKKSPATLIIAKMSKAAKPEYEPAKTNERNDVVAASIGYDAAAEEVLQAIESKNPKALVQAMKSFVDMCMSEAEDDSEASDMEEEKES